MFIKGQSGNPGGRPKGSVNVANYILKQTKSLREVVDKMLEIARDDTRGKNQIAALQWLADRGIGKAPESVTVTGELTIETFIREVEAAERAGLFRDRAMVN